MISGFVSSDLSGWTLLWQSSLCMLLGLLGSFLFRRQAARAHQVLMLGIMMSLLVPFLSLGVSYYGLGLLEAAPQNSPPVPPKAVASVPTRDKGEEVWVLSSPTVNDASASPESAPSSATPLTRSQTPAQGIKTQPVLRAVMEIVTLTRLLLVIWGLVSLGLLLRLLRTFVLGLRLLPSAQPLENEELTELLNHACTELGVRPRIDIRVSSSVRSPMIWCWSVRPILLIPTGTNYLTRSADWLGLFCHEVAHWKRRDHWVGLGSELAVCLIWWHPLLWWAKQRLLFLSEQACDDWVLASGQTGPDYAELLLNLLPEGRMAFVPTVVGKEHTMKARIHRIIKNRVSNPRVGWPWALAALLITASLAVGTALAQRRPARAPRSERQEHQAQQEELHETLRYLETRMKTSLIELETLEQKGRGQGMKARILRDEVQRLREQLRELKPMGEERLPRRRRPEAPRKDDRSDLTKRRDALTELVAKLERELGGAFGHRPERAKKHQETLTELHRQLIQVQRRLEQDAPGHDAHAAEHQAHLKAHQVHVQNLRKERDQLAQKAEHLEQRLHESGDRDPDLQEQLHRELDAMHKQLDHMSATLEDHAPGPHPEPRPEPDASHDRLQEIRELEQQAKRRARALKELQDKGRLEEARAMQIRLQEIRAHLAEVREEMKSRDLRERELTLLKVKEDRGRIDEVRSILEDQILHTKAELEDLPEDRDDEAHELRAHLDMLNERNSDLNRRLSVLDEDHAEDMDLFMEMSAPRLPAQPGVRPGEGVQDQLNTLHGRMDELTGQMKELRHLLQQILERKTRRPPQRPRREGSELDVDFFPEPERPAGLDEP